MSYQTVPPLQSEWGISLLEPPGVFFFCWVISVFSVLRGRKSEDNWAVDKWRKWEPESLSANSATQMTRAQNPSEGEEHVSEPQCLSVVPLEDGLTVEWEGRQAKWSWQDGPPVGEPWPCRQSGQREQGQRSEAGFWPLPLECRVWAEAGLGLMQKAFVRAESFLGTTEDVA